jgi:uncharacterized protein YdeI (YjbR/CyaY-like superfamily)
MSNESAIKVLLGKEKWHMERKKLRTIVLGCHLVENLKWGKLCYSRQGSNIVIIYGMKNYCALGFFSGSLLKDEDHALVQPGKHSQAMRQLRFKSLGEIEKSESRITSFIEKAIQAEKDGLKVDFDERVSLKYPDELRDALKKDAALAQSFQELTPGRKRGYVLHLLDAKQSETRARRIEKCRSNIINGMGLNER